jgi:ribosomal protein S27AE
MGLERLLGSPVGLLLVVVTLYLLHSFFWPFKDCPRCGGSKKINSPFGGSYRKCPRCGGSGTKTRRGRRMIGYMGSRRRRR